MSESSPCAYENRGRCGSLIIVGRVNPDRDVSLADLIGVPLNHFTGVGTLLHEASYSRKKAMPNAIGVLVYWVAQVNGDIAGTVVANVMVSLPAVTMATKSRSGGGLWVGEMLATFGLGLGYLRGSTLKPPGCRALRGGCLALKLGFERRRNRLLRYGGRQRLAGDQHI